MANSKIIFIVGAGASRDVGLPLGTGLASRIASMVNFKNSDPVEQSTADGDILSAIRMHAGRDVDITPYISAGRHIARAMPLALSIDNFINDHAGDPHIELCSKLGIVRSILRAERKSELGPEQNQHRQGLDHKHLANFWYQPFFKLLNARNSGDRNQLFDDTTMIIFNYDRCVEHFLFHAIQDYYDIAENEVVEVIERLKIFHPYGKVGHLPWQADTDTFEFGASVQPADLLKLAHGIKTFGESLGAGEEIDLMHQSLEEADIVVFLGFGFLDMNMNLMKIPSISKLKHVFATTRGVSGSELPVVLNQIKNLGKTGGHLMDFTNVGNNIDCSGLFEEYQRNLIHA